MVPRKLNGQADTVQTNNDYAGSKCAIRPAPAID